MKLKKKSTFWILIVVLTICLLVGTCFLTSCGHHESDGEPRQEHSEPGTELVENNREEAETDGTDCSAEENLTTLTPSGMPDTQEGVPVDADNYAQLIAGLESEMFYSQVKISGDVGEVVFVSDGTYLNPTSGTRESFQATVYYIIGDTLYDLGEVSGSGTAYPICYNQDGIFVAGGHYVGRYLPNPETAQLELVSYAGEVFDEAGSVTYWYYENGEERVVEDSSYLDALNLCYSEAKTVEFHQAVKELVPQVTIAPMATITALPMETVAEVDLDGDGETEVVQVKAMKEGKDGNLYLSDLELPFIQIGTHYFNPEALYNSVNYYDENMDISSYFIFDLDVNDSYKEIGLYFDGPSGDPETLLLRYKDGYLSMVGTFQSEVISDVCPSFVMWGCEYVEPQDYREILETTKRDEIQLTVPGNGMVYAEGRFDLIETAWAGRSWKLDEISGKLIEVEQENYTFTQYKREFPVTLKQEIEVYASILFEGEPITIPAGEKLTFMSYKPQGNWVEIGYGLKEEVGAEKEEFLFEHTGWLQVIDGEIVTPSGKYSCFDLFDNLNMAD